MDRTIDQQTQVPYQEPTPITDKENPFESMMRRFDVAAELLGLEPGVYSYLKTPVKQVIISIPIYKCFTSRMAA